jgi:hypothetical protein
MFISKRSHARYDYTYCLLRCSDCHYNLTNVNENKNLEDYYTYNDDINEDSNVSLVISTFPLAISEDEFAKSS